jgi:hypothetical protein
MTKTAILKAAGLNKSPNQLDVPEGSLAVANNVVITRDNVIQQARGYKIYGTELPDNSKRVKQLLTYRDTILRHYDDKIQYDSDDAGNFKLFTGQSVLNANDYRVKSVEANGNIYITTKNGVMNVSAKTRSDMVNSSIKNSHLVKALDITGTTLFEQGSISSWFLSNSRVAYRVVWAVKDRNQNLYEGVPSQRLVLDNSLESTLINDFNNFLTRMDNLRSISTSTPSDAITSSLAGFDYFNNLSLPSGSSSINLLDNLNTLANSIDNDLLVGNTTGAPINLTGATISSTSGTCVITKAAANFNTYFSAGSVVNISGLTGSNQLPLNGRQTIVEANATELKFLYDVSFVSESLNTTCVMTLGDFGSIPAPSTPTIPTTAAQLLQIKEYFQSIVNGVLTLKTGVYVDSTRLTEYVADFQITETASTRIQIPIPTGVTEDYFMEVYRSPLTTATDTTLFDDLVPSDEMQQIYEQYASASDISTGYITFTDETPEEFRGANLYTNPSSGEGIINANEAPPFAEDINRYKNVVFYANTKTTQKLQISLLGVSNIIDDIANSPSLSIINSSTVFKLNFVVGSKQTQTLTCSVVPTNGQYFDLTNANNEITYRMYYKVFGQTLSPPTVTTQRLIRIDLQASGETTSTVASKTSQVIDSLTDDFTVPTVVSNVITIENVYDGPATSISVGTSGFSSTVTAPGVGEDVAAHNVHLSDQISVAKSVEETARSICRVLNSNATSPINAYYISGAADVPGQILFEARNLNDSGFYVISNNSVTGASFNPDCTAQYTIGSATASTDIIVKSAHGYSSGDEVVVNLSGSAGIDGLYKVDVIDTNSFYLVNIVTTNRINVLGNTMGVGSISATSFATQSDDERKVARLYYSKLNQPESVPLINYFDVGAQDSAILRIFPLRDSLFVFKQDGLYRVSGETAPFSVQLFDSNTLLTAPDSVDALANMIFCWTNQGISIVSESGTKPALSRPIDVDILKVGANISPNFATLTYAVAYQSDNSYYAFSKATVDSTESDICYRYSNLTNSWTTLLRNSTCAAIHPKKDKLYIAPTDVAYIEEERKAFTREDFCGRQYDFNIDSSAYVNASKSIVFSDVSNMSIGDVITQEQTLSVYKYNSLLNQLDTDLSMNQGLTGTYYSTLQALAGDNMRYKLELLASRINLDNGTADLTYLDDISSLSGSGLTSSLGSNQVTLTKTAHGLIPGRVVQIGSTNSTPSLNGTYVVDSVPNANSFVITVPESIASGTTTGTYLTLINDFRDIKACYNNIVNKLNNDTGVNYSNYPLITETTTFEGTITAINTTTKVVTLDVAQEFTVGAITLFKAIEYSIKYSPVTFGSPFLYKQFREVGMLFQDKNFTNITVGFSTDLLIDEESVQLEGSGPGIFGKTPFGLQNFGGLAHSAPLRTYVPRNKQRGMYLVINMSHSTARESFSLYGINLVARDTTSTRVYR